MWRGVMAGSESSDAPPFSVFSSRHSEIIGQHKVVKPTSKNIVSYGL